MNREDIIRLAREAGEVEGMAEFVFHPVIERFAALVASAERERIKQANAPEIKRINAHIKELEDAVLAEREACVQIVENEAFQYASPVWAFEIVNDIKARGQA
jgi:hypothetical protein